MVLIDFPGGCQARYKTLMTATKELCQDDREKLLAELQQQQPPQTTRLSVPDVKAQYRCSSLKQGASEDGRGGSDVAIEARLQNMC